MKHHRLAQLALLMGCALPVLLLLIVPFRGQRDVSIRENRSLSRFPAFSLSSFAAGDYQKALESALGDQYPWGEEIKGAVLDAQNAASRLEGEALTALFPGAGQAYAEITPGYCHFAGDAHRIVEKPWDLSDETGLRSTAALFNAAENMKKFVYFIRNSRTQDFTRPDAENAAAFDAVRSAYRAEGYACFSAGDYEEYCRLFYQTDHHWNKDGADRGYREILRLLGVEEEPAPIEKDWTFDVVFNGSYARQTKVLCADEKFSAYSYPAAKMKVTLSGKKGQYGHQALYEKNRFPTDELRNHYAYYYGGDYGEILIDSGRKTGRSLLLIADSYSNPLNLLLARHFDRTCVIDLRYYEQDMGKPFDVNSCAAEYQLDTLLMLGDAALFFGAQGEGAER